MRTRSYNQSSAHPAAAPAADDGSCFIDVCLFGGIGELDVTRLPARWRLSCEREGMGFSEMGTCYFENAGLRNTYTTRLNTEQVSHKGSVIGWENFLYHFKSLRDVLQQNLQIFGSNIFLGAMIQWKPAIG